MNGCPAPADPDDIVAWQRLGPRITTSGALKAEDLPRLAAIGVRQLINLALDSHPLALAGEAALCAAQGIGYVHIPVPFDAPDDGHFARFQLALAAAGDMPVHVHCIANWRVSAFFYRHHRDCGVMPEDEARALMERQWSPAASPHPDAPAWAAFIAR